MADPDNMSEIEIEIEIQGDEILTSGIQFPLEVFHDAANDLASCFVDDMDITWTVSTQEAYVSVDWTSTDTEATVNFDSALEAV